MNARSKAKRRTMTDVLAQIKADYASMTPAFQSLARYVVDHHKELAFASAARVAAVAGSSAASVVRFSESLGLSGYTALQSLAREELSGEVSTVTRLEQTAVDETQTSLLESVVRTDMANLAELIKRADNRSFDAAVSLMAGADAIHLVGLRSTFGLVKHFQAYLGWIGRPANVLHPNVGDLPEQLLMVKPGDVCVCLSLRRYTQDTVRIARAARDSGATIIALTDSELSPLAELATVTLVVPVQSPTFFESKVGVMSLMNALLLGLSLADRERTLASLKRHERAWVGHEIYSNENFSVRLRKDMDAFDHMAKRVGKGAGHGPATGRRGKRREPERT